MIKAKNIGIQGQAGSYHEKVARAQYKDNENINYEETFSDAFIGLMSGKNDEIIVAIANNRYGFIQESYREIIDHKDEIRIIGEYYLAVKHQLLAVKGSHLSEIEEVISQPVAIGQCRQFLENNLPNVTIVEHNDTADSAKIVAQNGAMNLAAIASTEAGKLYDLDVIKEDIQDDPDNITRFLVIKKAPYQDDDQTQRKKHTAILKTNQATGSLANVLLVFKEASINISSLHSSFLPNTNFQMQFFIEFTTEDSTWQIDQLVSQIKLKEASLQILGSYIPHIKEA